MKNFTLVIKWDRLRKGEFPAQELKDCDPMMQIEDERISVFERKITLTSEISDDEDINALCYEIGSLIGTLVTNRHHR